MLAFLRLSMLALAASAAAAAQDCTFTAQCDYGKGSRASAPAATQEACCTLCQNRGGCAAGVFDGTTCWFKTAGDIKGGCQKSARVKAACVPKGVKPGPPPAPPPAPGPSPPGPPKPAPPAPPSPAKPTVPPTPAPKCAPGSKPLQVFIMMGQSNMLGEGHIGDLTAPLNHTLANAVLNEGKYPYLYDKTTKNWTTSKTVRNVFVMSSGGPVNKYGTHIMTNQWMTVRLFIECLSHLVLLLVCVRPLTDPCLPRRDPIRGAQLAPSWASAGCSRAPTRPPLK